MKMKAALAAARAGDWPTCLSALLVAWRTARDPKLADLIERIGASIPSEHAWKFEGGEGLIVRFAGDRATVLAQSAKVDLDLIAMFIDHLPPGTIRTFAFDLPPRPTVGESGWMRFEQALRTHGVDIPARPR